MRKSLAGSAVLLVALIPGLLQAQEVDPLRLVPADVDALLKLESPLRLYNAVYGHEAFQELLKIDFVAALYDTANIRRAQQIIAFVEKDLGRDRLELLERLTGDGVAVAAQFEKKAALLVVESRDAALLARFMTLARKILDQELARQDMKGALQARSYRDIETFHLGNDLHIAKAGSALIISNQEAALQKAVDLYFENGVGSIRSMKGLAEIKSHLPKDVLAWGMLNLEQIKKQPGVKNVLDTLGLDPVTMFVVGGVVDVIRRSPYVVAGVTSEGKNFHGRLAMPAGREGMAPLSAMLVPEDDNGSLPMLKPPRVLSSTSYYLDLGRFYSERHKILTPEQAKAIDSFEKQTTKFLKGISVGTILQQAGKYHRFVVANSDKSTYKIKPRVATASFGVVLDMRDPAFAKSMSTVLRGAALVGSFQYGLRMAEEQHDGHTLVTYYFPEDGKFEGDTENFRFGFSPCFTHVGDQFVIASTLELGKDLIDCLKRESKDGSSPATQRTHLYGSGLATNLRGAEDLLVTQAILSQALPATSAKKQFDELIRLVDRLGQVNIESSYLPREYRVDVLWKYER